MKCHRRQLKIIQTRGSGLKAAEQRHLEHCPECRQFMRDYHTVQTAMTELKPVEPGAGLDAGIKAEARRHCSVRPQPAPAPFLPLPWRLTALAATVLILAAIWLRPSPWSGDRRDLGVDEADPIQTIVSRPIESGYRLEPGDVWMHQFEQELWLLEAELYVEHEELQHYSHIWLAEVD